MDKKELLQTIGQQKEEIARYKSRLRDVITAYKGLQTDKEAIEASFKALNKTTENDTQLMQETKYPTAIDDNKSNNRPKLEQSFTEADDSTGSKPQDDETVNGLRNQLAILMNSLATLSAEKSRMEASFQADKKQLRAEREERDKKNKDLQERLQNMTKQRLTDVESIKSKLIVERHEREKEQNDHGVMIRELQKLLSEDRRAKEQLENQLDEMRSRLSSYEGQSNQHEQYERKLRDLRNELESTRSKLQRAESKAKETPPLLVELQNEIAHMKVQHQAAIREEQKRAADAEERARRLAANHEERVANLEGRLAELSNTVGSYDRLRQQDQQAINKLKERIAQLDLEQSIQPEALPKLQEEKKLKGKSEADLNSDVQALVTKIIQLKGQLVIANQRSEKPIDIMGALNADESFADVHRYCQEEYQQLEHKFEMYKLKSATYQSSNARQTDNVTPDLNAKIQELKEKNHILSSQLEDAERECQHRRDESEHFIKSERAKHKEQHATMENSYKRQILSLEQELKKQRERSIVLLEEKDQEIQTLKSTFQMFIPGQVSKGQSSGMEHAMVSDDVMSSFSHLGNVLRGSGSINAGGSPHMLHYAHELSRRDVEISTLRKSKYSLECTFRELQRETSREEEKYKAKIKNLQDEVGRFQRCQSRESANLEYLKNVVLSFLLSKNPSSRQHMLNAIAAVLRFSPEELEKVNQAPVSGSGM